jgi:hypothetical protein
MKKCYFLLLALLAMPALYAQNCIVDASAAPDAGIYPPAPGYIDAITRVIVMPSGNEGVFYDQTAQVKVPNDTIVDTLGFQLTAVIDSMRIHALVGMPPGLTYACNNARCVWVGGANGCVRIQGTPSQEGTYMVRVRAVGFATLPILGAVVDTFNFDMRIEVGPTISTNDFDLTSLKLYPNPASDFMIVDGLRAQHGQVTLELIHISGAVVKSTTFRPITGSTHRIDLSGLPQGLYHYRISAGDQRATGNISIAR